MSGLRVEIDARALRRMYVHEHLSTTAIAARLGCGPTTIGRRLRAAGIQRRRRGSGSARDADRYGPEGVRWSAALAWVVGLIATDGNLAWIGNRITLTSTDVELLERARCCLGLSNRIGWSSGGLGAGACRLQWRDRSLYDWLLGIGLTPRKSVTIGPLAVPDEYLADFFRGCIDGDGTIQAYTDRHHTRKNPAYVYTRLYVSLVSASHAFIVWLRSTIERLLALRGAVHVKQARGRSPVWVLRYSRKAAERLLTWMYYAPDVPCLARKKARASPFIDA